MQRATDRSPGFFDGVRQAEVLSSAGPVKSPVFYQDAHALIAVFPARMRALRQALPSRRFEPARLAPGVGALAISCFEYRASDIGPYNEVGVSIMLDRRQGMNLPGRALASNLLRGEFDAFVLHLPVTTDVARVGGIEFWNYPKFLADIEFTEDGEQETCRLSVPEGDILTLRGSRIPTPQRGERWLHTFTWMDGRPQQGDVSMNATALGVCNRLGAATVELGEHAIGRELRAMLLTTRSLQYQRIPHYEAILHAPTVLSPALVQSLAAPESTRDAPRVPVGRS